MILPNSVSIWTYPKLAPGPSWGSLSVFVPLLLEGLRGKASLQMQTWLVEGGKARGRERTAASPGTTECCLEALGLGGQLVNKLGGCTWAFQFVNCRMIEHLVSTTTLVNFVFQQYVPLLRGELTTHFYGWVRPRLLVFLSDFFFFFFLAGLSAENVKCLHVTCSLFQWLFFQTYKDDPSSPSSQNSWQSAVMWAH